MVGVDGSSPFAPTNIGREIKHLAETLGAFFLAGMDKVWKTTWNSGALTRTKSPLLADKNAAHGKSTSVQKHESPHEAGSTCLGAVQRFSGSAQPPVHATVRRHVASFQSPRNPPDTGSTRPAPRWVRNATGVDLSPRAAGEVHASPTFTRGMVAALDDQLSRRIRGGHD